jgi:polyadenylation factor subunit 2
MKWSHNDDWMVTADHHGFIKYWQSNMNPLKVFQGHKEAIRDLRYSLSYHGKPKDRRTGDRAMSTYSK